MYGPPGTGKTLFAKVKNPARILPTRTLQSVLKIPGAEKPPWAEIYCWSVA